MERSYTAALGAGALAALCCAWRRASRSDAATASAEATAGDEETASAGSPGSAEPWQRPDADALERLHHELAAIEGQVGAAREAALAAAHGSPEEVAELERQVQPRAGRDAEICAACAAFERALQEGQELEQALAALDAVVPVPQGVRSKPEHLAKFAAARGQRHQPAAVRKSILSKIRAEQRRLAEQPQVDGAEAAELLQPATRDMLREAQATAEKDWRAAVDRGRGLLLWSDHSPIKAVLAPRPDGGEGQGPAVRVIAWNVLERQPDGVKPVVPFLPFLQRLKKKGASALLERAMLDPAMVAAHAEAVTDFVLRSLEQGVCDAFCLAEVGAPLIAALQRSGAVVAVSAKTKSKSANRSGACEARTAVVARSGTPGEDLVVEVEGKVRRYAVLKVRPRLAVVAIHVMRNDGSEQPKIATGHALQALQAPTGQLGKDWTVVAAGDWNFSRQLLQPERLGLATSGASYQVLSALPGVPTTLADQLKWVDGDRSTWSDGIDGALVLAPPGDATLAVKVV